LPDAITAVPELVKAITDAGLSIWKAFHDAGGTARRDPQRGRSSPMEVIRRTDKIRMNLKRVSID
jgi:hypothetical protein